MPKVSIQYLNVDSVMGYLRDIVLLGKCKFDEAVARLLKEHGIPFKTGLIKSFRTKIKEAALLIRRKLVRKVSIAELQFMQRYREWFHTRCGFPEENRILHRSSLESLESLGSALFY